VVDRKGVNSGMSLEVKKNVVVVLYISVFIFRPQCLSVNITSSSFKVMKCCYHLDKDPTRGYTNTDSHEENKTGQVTTTSATGVYSRWIPLETGAPPIAR